MSAAPRRRRRDEGGFTLTELLACIGILAVIGVVLTEAVILGLRTTDRTVASSSRWAATQALASYFTDDVQSAANVFVADPSTPSCAQGPVFLHLTWTDQGVSRAVSYGLDPPAGTEQDVIRWSCTGGARSSRILGHFSGNGAAPVSVSCDGAACPAAAAVPPPAPAAVTLRIEGSSPLELTVRRRLAP